MQNTIMDIEQIDESAILQEEQFFQIMSGAIMKIGIWGCELMGNADKILESQEQVVKF